MRRYNSKSQKVALGGIVTLLSTVSLYISSILPTNRLFFFALSTFFLAAIIIENNIGFAVLVYFSSSILSFIIIPNKAAVLPYAIFFGYYAIVKSLIERINILAVELFIKFMLFNLSIYITYSIVSRALLGEIIIKLPAWAVFLLMQLAFIVYDYAFSLGVYFYRNKIRPKIR
ncbi:hypothetical protein [Proteiniborus sp. MB09-C3]|uniref:hypothetical protein n=1 Tax=Proteiniborus sp. MB09-C3 TaxID=3050072 RepID=UPI002553A426|nr:hypothetical protein [Proteiniborus sp. MB09-C3]WIV11279.1 hypothetical protein QO263_14120 [Proteiniborus sp. MB09-C3]